MGNVLIVDDEQAIGDYLARLITRLGHQAETTMNAADTLAKLDSGGFQLVIADIRLPDAPDAQAWVTGLCQKAKDIPVVLISGAPSAGWMTAQSQRRAAFLSKPFELAFIKNILQNVFPGSPKRDAPQKEVPVIVDKTKPGSRSLTRLWGVTRTAGAVLGMPRQQSILACHF